MNGEFYLCYHFFFSQEFLKDYEKFRMQITNECEKLGEEAEKVFNRIQELIFNEQINDTYHSSDERPGANKGKSLDAQKYYRKLKKLIMIAEKYKIKSELAGSHRLRSHFKKIYLKQSEKPIHNIPVI